MIPEYIIKYYKEHAIVWFREFNQYVITNKEEAESQNQIDVLKSRVSVDHKKSHHKSSSRGTLINPEKFKYRNCYKLNGSLFEIQYETEDLQTLINPKFDYLNSEGVFCEDPYLVFWQDQDVILKHKNKVLFKFHKQDLHEFSGKISMLILNTIYNRCDEDWLAVFHASFVSERSKGVLIIGGSGSGKSTAAAILMAQGLNIIADDFVPLNLNQKVNFFTAATSIKESVEQELKELFPELCNSIVYRSSSKEINVKYLRPRDAFYNEEFEISAVISIKYDPEIDFEINKLSRNDFISQIIPDTWTSPIAKNVDIFLDWLLQVPAYQLSYSSNEQLAEEIRNLMDDE